MLDALAMLSIAGTMFALFSLDTPLTRIVRRFYGRNPSRPMTPQEVAWFFEQWNAF
jgi:hypothetical protein